VDFFIQKFLIFLGGLEGYVVRLGSVVDVLAKGLGLAQKLVQLVARVLPAVQVVRLYVLVFFLVRKFLFAASASVHWVVGVCQVFGVVFEKALGLGCVRGGGKVVRIKTLDMEIIVGERIVELRVLLFREASHFVS
jgi:hypothetical protein